MKNKMSLIKSKLNKELIYAYTNIIQACTCGGITDGIDYVPDSCAPGTEVLCCIAGSNPSSSLLSRGLAVRRGTSSLMERHYQYAIQFFFPFSVRSFLTFCLSLWWWSPCSVIVAPLYAFYVNRFLCLVHGAKDYLKGALFLFTSFPFWKLDLVRWCTMTPWFNVWVAVLAWTWLGTSSWEAICLVSFLFLLLWLACVVLRVSVVATSMVIVSGMTSVGPWHWSPCLACTFATGGHGA